MERIPICQTCGARHTKFESCGATGQAPPPLGPIERTRRNFQVITFTDHAGQECTLQQSSTALADQPGAGAIWLGCNTNQPPIDGNDVSPRMHLTLDQVRSLVAHLEAWIENGTFDL